MSDVDLAAHRLDPARDQRRRADERHARAAEHERLDLRARDARVEHVADDRDVQALEAAERLLDRVEVEQRLRRVLVLAVAGVDDVRVGDRGDELRRADLRVADHDHVRVVGGSVSAVSFSDSPLSTDEPVALIDIVSAESRLAASSKLDDVRVEDSKKRLTTCGRAASAASSSRARARARSVRAVASSRSTSSRVEVLDREQVPPRRARAAAAPPA